MAAKPLQKISIDDLCVGMHVVDLDISWFDSPFIRQKRTIKTPQDIALLRKAGVKTLTIDPNKSTHKKTEKKAPAKAPENEAPIEEPKAPVEPPPPKSEAEQELERELKNAENIRSQVFKAIDDLHHELNNGRPVNTAALTPLIDQTLESLNRNDSALMNLAHIQRRSKQLREHTFSTFCLTLHLAQFLKIHPDDIEVLGIAALLHEIGWTQIPIHLMGKRNAYTDNERKLIQQHTIVAQNLLKEGDYPELSMRIIAEHHELCNGSGYPKGLVAAQIHSLSKLFTVVDRYDEIVHQLTDSPGMLPHAALKHLYQAAESKMYAINAVSGLLSVLGVIPISSAIRLNDGTAGIVIGVHRDEPIKPLVEIRIDADGKLMDTPYCIDLANTPEKYKSLAIDHVFEPGELPEDMVSKLQL